MLSHGLVRGLLPGVLALTLSSSHAQMVNLYVGIDSREILPSGVFAGLPNPNASRLTLLYAHGYEYGEFHGNHYHGIGGYTFSGTADEHEVQDTSGGNQIPEVYTGLPGVALVPGEEEPWLGRLVSRKHAEHYSDFRIRSVHSLAPFGFGSSEWYMFHSSADTRTNLLTDAEIALELVSKSPELHIADVEGNPILSNPGEVQTIGDGNDPDFEFLPVFWVEHSTPPGTYTAEFRLIDLNEANGREPFPSSGRFTFVFRVPEPAELEIQKTVTLSMPLVTEGYVLESAPSPEGPWTPIPFPPGENTRFGQTTTSKELTIPVQPGHIFFQLRRIDPQ